MPKKAAFREDEVVFFLQMLPPSIREGLLADQSFQDEYGLKPSPRLTFSDIGIIIARSELFESVRLALKDPSQKIFVKDVSDGKWEIEILDVNAGSISLCKGDQRINLLNLWPLLPETSKRMEALRVAAHNANLPDKNFKKWSKKLDHDPVRDSNVDAVLNDLSDTPVFVMDSIKEQLDRSDSNFLSLVPNSIRYFERLVGQFNNNPNLHDYVFQNIYNHIESLISWSPKEGLSLALLLSAHSSILRVIDLYKINDINVIEVFKQITEKGDRFSQLGAIELGLSVFKDLPDIEHYLFTMIEQILDDDLNLETSRLQLLSSLIVLVDGQLSFTKCLAGKPPFWRRLASIAHASLIDRCLVGFPVDVSKFKDWVMQGRGQQFYLQTLCDLRNEPKWQPDYVSAEQLRFEFIGRIYHALQTHSNSIKKSSELRVFLETEHSKNIHQYIKFPHSFLPGPLEGGTEPIHDLPPELDEAIKKNLLAERLEKNSFNALINSALVFNLGQTYAEMAAKAFKEAKYYVKHGNSQELFPLLSGLAIVAAVTRSTKMADELRILTRRSMYLPRSPITPGESFRIGLISAASRVDLNDWCSFVGEWTTELAFGDLNIEEAKVLHSHIKCLCRIVPELWPALGRAEAALVAFIAK